VDDQLAAQVCLRDAWPAPETEPLAGWQLRAGAGGYNRANSVWSGRFTGELPLEAAIDRAEAFYRARNLVPRFQLLDIAQPAGLDSALAQRGYLRDVDCSDMAKGVTPVSAPAGVAVTHDPPEDWIALYRSAQPPQKSVELPRILARLPSAHGFVVCRRNGRAEAVALVGRIGTDVAVDCVLTRPNSRRGGAATAVLMAAEAWAAGEGARRLLLSVVDGNAAAVPLYLKLGYRKFAAYYYRFRPV
jgi:ribosomal protein S18 acetylase RimI-like enzyme